MEDVRHLVEDMPQEVLALIGHALQLVETEAKALRKKLEKAGYSLEEVDANLNLLKGKDGQDGLLAIFGVKEPGDTPDPAQVQMFEEGERDFRTHALTTEGVTELVAGIVSDNAPVKAVAILNGLEEGERDKEGGPRESVLKVIRGARAPIAKKVGVLEFSTGGTSD